MIIPISNIEKGEAKISITLGDDLVCFLANYTELITCENGTKKPAAELVVGERIVFELFDGKDTLKKPTQEEFRKIEQLFLSKRRFHGDRLSDFILHN